jgi:hypothetical protein
MEMVCCHALLFAWCDRLVRLLPSDFDANGNLLTLDNIGTLNWYYNNTLNKLTKTDKLNTIQYYVYDYQGRRVRTVIESGDGLLPCVAFCLV